MHPKKVLTSCMFLLFGILILRAQDPIRIGIIGLSHDHVHQVFNLPHKNVDVVTIVEEDPDLVDRYTQQYHLDKDIFFESMDAMINQVEVDAVMGFGPIREHLPIVQTFAPIGVHIMVEKPLEINYKRAQEIADLARQHDIQVLTNYETTWYPSNHEAYKILNTENQIGEARRVIINDGHEGPQEIGVSKEFLNWLRDPKQNGGGAVIDFGCYGANLMTWLMQGKEPTSVKASLKQHKPKIYPDVDDDATIIVDYPGAQAVIQASWNWPFSRKDMEIYGATGYAIAKNDTILQLRKKGDKEETVCSIKGETTPYKDAFDYLYEVVKGRIQPDQFEPSSLENNLLVMKILDAARESANTGKSVKL